MTRAHGFSIVVSTERKRLNGHIEAVYQKGSLPTRQVIDVIEEANELQEQKDENETQYIMH